MRAMACLVASLLIGSMASGCSTAHAEDKKSCAITYTRTACPGQETESYKKCDGKKTCTKDVSAASADECRVAALSACANDRLTITASKTITATFEGKVLKSKSGKDDFCLDYDKRAAEFDQCKKK